jgi:hypothetical protein
MKKIIFLLLFPIVAFAQIGINTTTPKAALDVESSVNGILIPRVQLIDALDTTTILNPNGGPLVTSTMVYNIIASGTAPNNVVAGFYYWNGSKWTTISGNATNSWSLEGNSGTNPATLFGSNFVSGENFIGTTDYKHLLFGTNNRPIMKISDFGNVGIGVNNPFAKLHIDNQDSEITSFINKRNLSGGFGGSFYVSPTFVVRTESIAGGTSEVYHNSEFIAFGTNAATNVAGFFSASQAANNYAIIVPENGGNVGIGTATPTEKLHVFSNLDTNKSSIFGSATQASTAADFLNVGVKGNGNGSGSFGFGVGVLGTTDVNTTWNSTGVYAQLGVVNPSFSSFTSSNQALVANGNGLGRSAMFLGGNVGIGLPLTTNPSTLVHINSATNGAVTIVDGTEANGKVLTSNATGTATWQNPIPSGFTHYLGELYLGGVIFELYKGSDGLEHGLVVALTESSRVWQTTNTLINANRSEDGVFNTALMTSSPAATYIASLGAGWYLPSIDELNLLYNNRYYANKALRLSGNTLISRTALYWSSTEYTANSVYALFSFTGTNGPQDKSDSNLVRAIRAF